jgi:uncharacterized protein YfaS (alpha-2-macroglobulin family)
MKYLHVYIIILLFGCFPADKKSNLLNPDADQKLLSPYFLAATSGIISAGEELTYMLKHPVEMMPDDATLQQIITLSPKTEGTTTLSANGVLRFKPKKTLQPGTEYEVNLQLTKLGKSAYAEDIRYRIRTMEQGIFCQIQGPIIQEDGAVLLEVDVQTADIADIELLAKCFSAQDGQITVEAKSTGGYLLKCLFPEGYNEKSIIRVDGTPVGDSKVQDIKPLSLDDSEMYLVNTWFDHKAKEFHIYFSQWLDADADLTGLVEVASQNPSYTIRQNVLTLYVSPGPENENRTIKLYPGIRSAKDRTLRRSHVFSLPMDKEHPAVAFAGSGNYFPGSGDFKIPVMTRALKSVRVTVVEIPQDNVLRYLAWQSLSWSSINNLRLYGRPVYDQIVSLPKGETDQNGWTMHGLDLSERVARNPGSMYHVYLDFGPENTSLACTASFEQYDMPAEGKKMSYFNVRSEYYYDYYNYHPMYSWEDRNDPCKISYYVNKAQTERTFICSDFGVIAKRSGTGYHMAITKLTDVSPVGNASLSLYNLQGMLMRTSTTDNEGIGIFQDVEDDAAVLMVEKDRKITYLPLDIEDANPLTEFDVSGDRTEGESAFYVYTSRDVWRPGDTIRMYVMLHGDAATAKQLPLTMKFYDADKLLIDKQIQPVDISSRQLYPFTTRSEPNAKTGLYHCIFQLGPKTLRKNIRIETITANTSETVYNLKGMKNGILYSKTLEGSLMSAYLTGQPIAGAKINGTARIKTITKPFTGYADYHFHAYSHPVSDRKWQAFSVVTNAAGEVSFTGSQDLTLYNAPVYINLETQTTFALGGTSTEGKTISAYPLESYVGSRKQDGKGWDGSHTVNEDIKISLVCLTAEGKMNPVETPVRYIIEKNTNSWWIDKYQLTSAGNFIQSLFWQEVRQSKTTVKGTANITLPGGSMEMGAYRITFVNDLSGHISQQYFNVHDGLSRIPGNQPYILNFKTGKESYKAGEEIQIALPEIQRGKALVSIEQGNRIIQTKWMNAGEMSTLTAGDDWAPGVYMHISLVQPHSRETNDLPLRMYGTRYVAVSSEKSRLQPVVSIPDKLEASSSYTIQVSEKQGMPMEYTLALVDEGLLNLTGFSTPNPWNHFNGKFPLLVRTWDIYKYMIEYFRGTFAGIISIGGDNAYHPDAIPEINRTKPLEIQMGPFKLAKNGKASHTIRIPGYSGKARLMLVACNKEQFGSFEKQIPVKNPLMVQSQLPRTLNVTDKIRIPVSVTRDDAAIKNAQISVKTSGVSIGGLQTGKNITFSGKNQEFTTFSGEVPNQPGTSKITILASSNASKMQETGEVTINYPGSPQTRYSKQRVDPGKSATFTITPKGYADMFNTRISLTGVKTPSCTKYAEELIQYPYGCLEQRASAGFGQLYLDKIVSLSPQANEKRLAHLNQTVQSLGRFQRSDGRFNYWEGQTYHAWSDLYTGYFLIEAKQAGIQVPGDMLQRWLDAHYRAASSWAVQQASTRETYETESLVQAFRLYVLAKASMPAKPAMNRFISDNTATHGATWWLMAGSYSLSGYDSKAKDMVQKAGQLQATYDESLSYATFGDKARDLAIAVDVLGLMAGTKGKQDQYYEEMVDVLDKSPWTSTQTQGFACIATGKYLIKNKTLPQDIKGTINGLKGGDKSVTQRGSASVEIQVEKADYGKKITVKNTGKTPIYIHQTDTYTDNTLQQNATSSQLSLKMDVYNVTRKKTGTGDIRLGDELKITLKIANPSPFPLPGMALNLIVPSGIKLNNPRINNSGNAESGTEELYQDFRDDRVYTFFDLANGKTANYTFTVRAAFAGDFYWPSVRCESMYRGNIYASTASSRLIIRD